MANYIGMYTKSQKEFKKNVRTNEIVGFRDLNFFP
jgi:hypothetical protein